MVPQHNLKSKNIKEKSGSQSGHPVETPDKDLRRARKALPGGPGGDEKRGFLERRPPGSPEREHEKWASREPNARPGGPIRVKRRRATLPHPLECSTIAAPGLSYRVRNGTGRLTRAMTTANLTATARKPKESKPACHRWRFGNRLADARQSLPLYRSVTIPTHIAVQDDPAQERRGTNPPQEDRNVMSPSPVSTGRLHPSRGFHLRPIKHVFNMRATTVRDRTES